MLAQLMLVLNGTADVVAGYICPPVRLRCNLGNFLLDTAACSYFENCQGGRIAVWWKHMIISDRPDCYLPTYLRGLP
ncbi:hypothetical protein QBC45DRAFT_399340 [Copromyces sp. CBS 386.78]|nr:hypothetical protein QBC45DRAFT_399340 [Copromyces sp. CBS 386.78]